MIKWISAETPPKECSTLKEYLVTVEYDSNGNIKGRRTVIMTYQERGIKNTPTWCWHDRIVFWKVLYWAELPESYQDEI